MSGRIWIDVEDLFVYAEANPRPSGIQRLVLEICRALSASDRVRFVRHAPGGETFRTVPWAAIASLFDTLTLAEAPAEPMPATITDHGARRQAVRRLAYRLPPALRSAGYETLQTSAAAARAWRRLAAAIPRAIRPPRRRPETPDTAGTHAFETAAAGDVLVAIGAAWGHPDYAALIARQRARGLQFALLVYDLIPLRRPEWCMPGLVRIFRTWFPRVLPVCDHVLAISHATAADIRAYAGEHGIALPGPITVIPIGTGPIGSNPPEGSPDPAPPSARLPAPGSYALIVSTIEVRKNHALLFRIWRRLLDELPPGRVPTLVFAGRLGWLTGDLIRQIVNADYLGGKIVILQNPGDAELAALYRGCLFTLFPSFAEGWGLPVTESLAFGKPCLISSLTSLPEAGGTLARSFDPDNLHEAYTMIRDAIEDRAGLAAWQARIEREFAPVPWSAAAQALLDRL